MTLRAPQNEQKVVQSHVLSKLPISMGADTSTSGAVVEWGHRSTTGVSYWM